MIVIWSERALLELRQTLKYWMKRNGTDTYSLKIIQEVKSTEYQIALDPLFLSYYIKSYKVYRKSLLKGKFYLFYRIEGNVIRVLHFRSAKQAPLYMRYEKQIQYGF